MPLSHQEQCCSIDVGKALACAYRNNPENFKRESRGLILSVISGKYWTVL